MDVKDIIYGIKRLKQLVNDTRLYESPPLDQTDPESLAQTIPRPIKPNESANP